MPGTPQLTRRAAKPQRFQFLVTVEVDADIADKYPNYRFNYATPEAFARSRITEMPASEDAGFRLSATPHVRKRGWRQ